MIIAVNGHDLRAGRLTGVDADELRKVAAACDEGVWNAAACTD